MGTGDKSTVTNFWRGERGRKLSVGHSLARRYMGRKSPPSLSVMVVRTLQPTVRGLAMAGHLSTEVEAISYAKYSEKDDFIPKALLAPNRCWA